MKLKDIKKELEKYYVIADPYVVEVILATLIGNLIIPRDPLWTMLVASSSGGKSSLMAPCAGVPSVHFIDDLTEKTFLSGYKAGKKEVSLLKAIGNGVMCFSDFTSIISKNPVSKGEILSQFRLIFDGHFSKRTGTGEITWDGKMGFLGASTPDVYFQLEQSRSMGERFLYYAIRQPTDQEIVAKQESVKKSSKEIAEILKPFYAGYMANVRDWAIDHGMPELKMTDEQRYRVDKSAIFCVSGKTSIHLDFKSGRPDAMPNRPGVGRDRKMFDTMLHSLQLMNCYEHNDPTLPVQDWMIDVIDRSAWSSISRERRKLLEILTSSKVPMSATQIGASDNFGLQKEAVEKYLAPLFAVGIIKKQVNSNKHKWFIDDEDTVAFVQRVSESPTPELAPEVEDEDEPVPRDKEAESKAEKEFKNY
jgi:hypothetical protein